MRRMTYEEMVEWILGIPKFTSKNTLEHTRDFLGRLGDPQESFKAIHVAGSNGKGSVCACMESVLRAAGKRTGLFTSPHLTRIEERFRLNGQPCSQREFVWAAGRARRAAEKMRREGLPYPTFFECIFAMGMVLFEKWQVEYAVIETGLGGRLDATNIIRRPILTVITSISLEHTEILGSTVRQIASEKAGILKKGTPVVYDASEPEAEQVIRARAAELGCQVFPVCFNKIKILLNTGKKIAFSYDSGYDVTNVEIPFGAPYQAQNAAVALQAARCLGEEAGIGLEAVRAGFANVSWKGRMQEARPGVYFDGAHNLAGIERFLEAVEQVTEDSAVLLFSMAKDKDYGNVVRRLTERGNWETVVTTSIPGTRGADCAELAELFGKAAKDAGKCMETAAVPEIGAAFARALGARKEGQKVFCAGSLYLIGELERLLEEEKDGRGRND